MSEGTCCKGTLKRCRQPVNESNTHTLALSVEKHTTGVLLGVAARRKSVKTVSALLEKTLWEEVKDKPCSQSLGQQTHRDDDSCSSVCDEAHGLQPASYLAVCSDAVRGDDRHLRVALVFLAV